MAQITAKTDHLPQFYQASTAEELGSIDLPEINIVSWQRPHLDSLKNRLSLVDWPAMLSISGSFLKNKPKDSFENLESELNHALGFLQNDEKSLLIQDVMENASLFYHSFSSGVDTFKYELAVINGVMCPRFHMDYYKMRLIVTYVGDGTEWTTNDNIELNHLAEPIQPIIVLDERKYFQVNPMSVTLLKGNQYKTGHWGVVHRSPSSTSCQEKRLLLRFDA